MKTTTSIIKIKISKTIIELNRLRALEDCTPTKESPCVCEKCNTKNNHFSDSGFWVCAYC